MKDREALASGGIFVAVGCIYGASAMLSLPMGSMISMGPGYFPVVLSGLLVLLGGAIVLRGLRHEGRVAFGSLPWRAILMIALAILCFAFFIRSLGLFVTVLLTAFLSCLADAKVTALKAATMALAMAVLCTLIFSLGIGLPIPIFGSWLRGFI